jgi:hypothetical protein
LLVMDSCADRGQQTLGGYTMLKWLSVLSLLATLSAVGSGCTPCHMGYRPFRPGAVCDPTHCTDTCGPTLGAARCEVGCGSAECDPCDPCGPCYYGEYSPLGPLAAVFRIFDPVTWMGPSCGERYWGDFYGEPPDCCDPCDCYGNYTGMHVSNCPRRGAGCASGTCVDYSCESGTCVDYGCESGCADGGCSSAAPGFARRHRPTVAMPQEPAYLGQYQPRSRPPAATAIREPAYLGQHQPRLRSPAVMTRPHPEIDSRFAPRIISIDDRVVGEPAQQPTVAAQRLEAVRR